MSYSCSLAGTSERVMGAAVHLAVTRRRLVEDLEVVEVVLGACPANSNSNSRIRHRRIQIDATRSA